MPKASPALKTLIDGATSKNGASNAKKNGIGASPRLCCYWDASASATDPAVSGSKFLDCAIAGPLFVDTATGVIKNFGATSDVVLHNSVDLAQGSAALRIEGNGNYLQYTLGLSGSGKEFTVPSNLTPGQPFAFSSAATINPLASLPLNDAGGGGGDPCRTPADRVSRQASSRRCWATPLKREIYRPATIRCSSWKTAPLSPAPCSTLRTGLTVR
jgi:hypothetical protein